MRKKRRLPFMFDPPVADADGKMPLLEHVREFRYRVMVSVSAAIIGMIVAWFFFKQLFDVVMYPLNQAVRHLHAARPDLDIKVSYEGVTASFLMQLEVSALAGVIATCPIWIYQIWAFIAPGLYAKEKRYSVMFIAAAVPLFLAGVATGYFILPKGYEFMLNFVPNNSNALSLLEANTFLATEVKILLLFGVSYLLPVILVVLNMVGLLTGDQLRRFRRVGIFLCFLFGAVATPSADPFSMTALALPMAILYVVAEFICRRNDKRRAAHAAAAAAAAV